MKECPAFIAALPREVTQLVRGWHEHQLPGKIFVYTNDHAVIACAGMGAKRATLAVQAAMSLKPITALLSIGLAGACDPALGVGDIVRAGVVVDSSSGEQYANSQFRQVLVTETEIASVTEKQRLYQSYFASAVDMEAATVARLAKIHKLYFQATKSVSDQADFDLEELARFATEDGQFREAAFAGHAALRPQSWRKLFRLAANSRRAIESLTSEVESQLSWYRQRS
jgi:adenosylhomocysteine nucleosidase